MTELNYFDIAWFSTVDGPGTRVVLYLSGCNLRCPWCHSPHSWNNTSPLLYFENTCLLCGACVDTCAQNVHSILENKHIIDRSKCIQCKACIETCPSSDTKSWSTSTLGFAGMQIEVNELYKVLKPQLSLLKKIGGLTISGGDPILQSKSLAYLLERCSQDNIHTTVETSASSDKANIQELMPYVNHWLIGLRPSLIDREEDWKQVKENLQILAKKNPENITIRTPIIPGYTNTLECYSRIKNIMVFNKITMLEILPFNPYSGNYYKALGKDYILNSAKSISNSELKRAKDYFSNNGIKVKIVN